MAYAVFYAWQMDHNKKVCRWFIHKAAEDAIAIVNAGLALEDAPAVDAAERPDATVAPAIELDLATKGEPGTPMIAETIAKKIKACGVFLADVTLVAKLKTDDDREKWVPNPNVMIELGMAAATVGWERIILVMNMAFGKPEDLPFDLRHRSFPLLYDLKDPGESTLTALRKGLTKEIADKLRTMHDAGVWTKADEERRQEEAEQRQKQMDTAAAKRREFEERVAAGDYFGFAADQGIVAISIVPLTQVARRITIGTNDVQMATKFHPIGWSGGLPIHYTAKSVYFKDEAGVPGKENVQAVTEIYEDGCVMSVLNMRYGRREVNGLLGSSNVAEVGQPWTMDMSPFQPVILQSIGRYVNALRELGVVGECALGFSLLKMKNGLIVPSPSLEWTMRRATYRGDHVQPDAVIIEAGADLATVEAAGVALIEPLRQLWRAFGYPGAVVIDNQGKYVRCVE